jgi:chemotaxis protein CheD
MSTHWVGIGEIRTAQRGDRLAAVLGSCVGIVVWHPASGFALMNHILLPARLTEREGDNPGRYADESWCLIEHRLAARDIAIEQCRCHLVGGGRGLETEAGQSVGFGNVAAAFDILIAAGAHIESMDTGGRFYRVATFDIERGVLCVRRYDTRPAKMPVAELRNEICCGA